MGGWSMHCIAPMDFIDITKIAWVTHFGFTSKGQLWIMPLRNVYHHPKFLNNMNPYNIQLHIHGCLNYTFHFTNGPYWHQYNSFGDSFWTEIQGETRG